MSFPEQQRAELFELLELLREQRITKVQLSRLEEIILSDPAAMTTYVRYMAVAASLRQRLQSLRQLPAIADECPMPQVAVGEHHSDLRQRARWVVGAGIVLASLAMVVVLLSTGPRQIVPKTIGTLETISGKVFITKPGEPGRPAQAGTPILAGDSLRSFGLQDLAVIVRPDGTRLMLVGKSSMTCDSTDSNRVTVHKGILAAEVTPQRSGNPLEFVTTEGTTRVLGTRLALEATPNRTELTVTEGRVRFTRNKDGKSVEVPQGKRVVEGLQNDLVVSDVAGTVDSWSVDFEAGLPDGWKLGRAVGDDLPAGSKVAVASTADPQKSELSYGIVTTHNWARGLFAVRANSCLHITYKLDRPGWVQIFVGTRNADLAAATGANVYLLEPWDAAHNERWWDVPAGKWHTVSIPLSKFFKVTDRNAHAIPGDVCFGFTFNSQEHDRGLVIDKIRVTPDGPTTVEIEEMP